VAQTLARAPSWRKNAAALARIVAPGVPNNGFAVATATLDSTGWEDLRRALIEATTSTQGRGE